MKEKLKKSSESVLKFLNKFFNSDWFIVFYAGVIILSWMIECEYIAVLTSIFFLSYMFLTQEHLDRIAVIACIIPAMVDANMRHRISFSQIYFLVGLLLIVVGCGIYHFKKVHKKNDRKIINSTFFLVYSLTIVALALSGIGYPGHTLFKALIPVGVHLALLGLYVILYKTGSNELKNTIVKSIVALAGVIVVQMIIYFLRSDNALYELLIKSMSLGWAITNSVAVILTLAIPLSFYLSRGKKVQIQYMLLATIFYVAIFFTNCRSMILVGSVVYFICLILSFVFLNRWQALINLLVILVVGYFGVKMLYNRIFSQFILLGFDDNGRMELYAYYWSQFKEHWLFGMGFYTDTVYQADGMVRAHNTIIQICASMGLVGILNGIPYYFTRFKSFVVKPSVFKLFAFVAYLAMAGYGMVDCAIISSYKLIITYMLMLAVEFDTLEYCPIPQKNKLMKIFKNSKKRKEVRETQNAVN